MPGPKKGAVDARKLTAQRRKEIGAKGGKRRLVILTPEKRTAIAKHAAAARWGLRTKNRKENEPSPEFLKPGSS